MKRFFLMLWSSPCYCVISHPHISTKHESIRLKLMVLWKQNNTSTHRQGTSAWKYGYIVGTIAVGAVVVLADVQTRFFPCYCVCWKAILNKNGLQICAYHYASDVHLKCWQPNLPSIILLNIFYIARLRRSTIFILPLTCLPFFLIYLFKMYLKTQFRPNAEYLQIETIKSTTYHRALRTIKKCLSVTNIENCII